MKHTWTPVPGWDRLLPVRKHRLRTRVPRYACRCGYWAEAGILPGAFRIIGAVDGVPRLSWQDPARGCGGPT